VQHVRKSAHAITFGSSETEIVNVSESIGKEQYTR